MMMDMFLGNPCFVQTCSAGVLEMRNESDAVPLPVVKFVYAVDSEWLWSVGVICFDAFVQLNQLKPYASRSKG